MSRGWAGSVMLVLVASCQQPTTSNRFAQLEVVDAQGNARASVDFGRVPVAVAANHHVLIRNSGTAGLTVMAATFSDRVFGVETSLPFGVDAGATGDLVLRFTPSVIEQRVTGRVTLSSNDVPFELGLSGTGIARALVVMPAMLDFNEVYVGESKSLTLQLVNVSSAAVELGSIDGGVGVRVESAPTALAPGDQVVVQVLFSPRVMGEVISGSLAVGLTLVPMQGRAIQALPRACMRFAGGEQCSDGGVLSVDLEGAARTGSLFFRNEGNTPVSYTVHYEVPVCDGGGLAFKFSNAPGDGGITQWTEATTALPTQVTDSRPWETAPISVTAGACGPGTARLLWQRQDASHVPASMTVTLTGH